MKKGKPKMDKNKINRLMKLIEDIINDIPVEEQDIDTNDFYANLVNLYHSISE